MRPLTTALTLCALLLSPGRLFGSDAMTTTPDQSVPSGAEAKASAPQLTLDQIFAEDRPGAWPKQISWSPDGSRLAYLLPAETPASQPPPKDRGTVLWFYELASGEARPAFASSSLPAQDGKPGKLDGYSFVPGSGDLMVESAGAFFLVTTAGLSPLAAGQPTAELLQFSPDGRRLAYVRNANLFLFDRTSGKEKALTKDGKEGVTLNAKNDWVYWEEIWGRSPESFWWSPDGKHIAYYQFDETPVSTYPLLDPLPTYPTVEWQKYPKAGQKNPKVRLGVVDVAKGKTVWLKTGDPDSYLARVHWAPKGDRLVIQRLNRDQTQLDLLSCDAKTGNCTPFFSEQWKTWINLANDARFLKDGRFLWSSEKTGWRHLYLYDTNGKELRELTRGLQTVVSVDGVDEKSGKVTYTTNSGSAMGVANRMVWRLDLETGETKPQTSSNGWNEALVAPTGGHWLHTLSTSELPPKRRILEATGKLVFELPSGPTPSFDPASLPRWEYTSIWGLDGQKLPARLLKPANPEPGKRYPAIMYHYGGPASQVVSNRWDGRGRDVWHKLMAQRGYAVLMVDNITSSFFGKHGEDKVHRDFGQFNIDAQLAGTEFLKGLPNVDGQRIGLWGWSGGGTNTLMAVLKKPGVWKAAVAGAPVTDWKLYDSIWTERYLDLPEGNEAGYKASSPVTWADQLKDRLLLVHGTGDDNVHPQNTEVMSQAFIDAGVLFEELLLPNQKHGLRGAAERFFYQHMTDFFDRYLNTP